MDQISEEHCQSVLYPDSVSGSPKRTRNRKEKMFFVKNVKNNFVCEKIFIFFTRQGLFGSLLGIMKAADI